MPEHLAALVESLSLREKIPQVEWRRAIQGPRRLFGGAGISG